MIIVRIFRYLKTARVMKKELNTVLGKDCSCNWSPTLRAKLISVGENKSVLEVTPGIKTQGLFIGKRFIIDNTLVQNMYFF